MQKRIPLLLLLISIVAGLRAQDPGIERLIKGELKMTFPSIYFKHMSTDYATMPYTADSCFKFIALHIKDIKSLLIWRDSLETEELTTMRIRKLKLDLNKYTPSKKITIHAMGSEQKISRHTIEMTNNKEQIHYLLSLNSAFDISKTRFSKKKSTNHIEHPRILCMNCWKNGFHIKIRQQLRRAKKNARLKQEQKPLAPR
ncbi:MAG TPA: hypothetical protein VGC65_11250 [Bacteroidia bacterium]